MIISSDASKKGWGTTSERSRVRGPWTKEESEQQINILERKAIHLAILTFTLKKRVRSIHVRTDNMTALSYLVKIWGTKSLTLSQISKEIWEYLLRHGITVTAEYLPGILSGEADWESRNTQDSSEWMLHVKVFARICQILDTPVVDLFASRTSHQLPNYWSWGLDPLSQGSDSFRTNWNKG